MKLLSIWDIGICLKADKSVYLQYRHRKISDYMYSSMRYVVTFDDPISVSQTSENVSNIVQAASPTKTDVFCVTYNHVCCIYRFLSAVQLRSQCLPFSNLDGLKKIRTPNFSKILSAFALCIATSFSNLECSCSLIAEWISEWKHWNEGFPMWCRFSSTQVYIVSSLQSRGHK